MTHYIVVVDNVGEKQQQGRATLQRLRSITQHDDVEIFKPNDPKTAPKALHVGSVPGREKVRLAAVASADGPSCPSFG